MEFELKTPFSNERDLNIGNIHTNKSQNVNKRISYLSKGQFSNDDKINNRYEINKLKNDLRERPYNNNYINDDNRNMNNINPYINRNNIRDIKYYLSQINDFIEIVKPNSHKEINIKKLSLDIPLLIYIILILFKYFFSKTLNVIYLYLFILLPICAHILINKIIIEEYYYMNIINIKKILYKNFFKIFFNGYILFIIGYLITKLFKNILSRYEYLIQILYLIYASFIAEKIFVEYIISISLLINKNNLRNNIKKRDGKKVFFIFFVIYSIISYIINL